MEPIIKPFPLEKVPERIRDDIEEIYYNMAFNPKCHHLKGLWLVGKCLTDSFTDDDQIELITESKSEKEAFEAYLAALGGTCCTDDSDKFNVYVCDMTLEDVVKGEGDCLRLI